MPKSLGLSPEEKRERVRAANRVASAKRYASDPEPQRAASRAWRAANRDRKSATARAWYAANPGYSRRWWVARRERASSGAPPVRRPPRPRRLGGTWFTRVRPGYWLSDDRRLAIVQDGEDGAWVLFWTEGAIDPSVAGLALGDPRLAPREFWSGDEIAARMRFAELERDVAEAVAMAVRVMK